MGPPLRRALVGAALLALWTAQPVSANDAMDEMPDGEENGGEMPLDDLPAEGEGMEPPEPMAHEELDRIHKGMDMNKDGKVTAEEALQFAKHMTYKRNKKDSVEMFNGMDRSSDGRFQMHEHLGDLDEAIKESESDEERKTIEFQREWEVKRFNAADKNKDGELDNEEIMHLLFPETDPEVLRVATMQVIEEKDKDKDGFLSALEFWSEEDESKESEALQDEDFKKIDRNGDGKLDYKEIEHWESGHWHIEDHVKEMFKIADHDSDNHITAQEMKASNEKIANSVLDWPFRDWLQHHDEL